MSYIIGSFNIQKFNFKSNDETKKNFQRIANIIKGENFDVVALQEVMSVDAVKNLIRYLGPMYWDFVYEQSKITVSRDAQIEGYAFIWKKRRLRLVNSNSAIQVQNRYQIRKRYSDYKHSGSLIRPPMVARFTPQNLPGGSNFEIRLINTHIAFSSPVGCYDQYSNSDVRRMELKTLSEEIYRTISSKAYSNNLPSYTFLLGDYNLCLAGYGSPFVNEIIDITDKRKLRTVQCEKTSLKQTVKEYSTEELNLENDKDMVSDVTTDLYSKNYDHFSYEVSLDEKMKLKASRVDALGKYYNSDLELYRKEVSDHVPIKLKLNLKTR